MTRAGCVKLADFGAAAQLSATRGHRDTFIGSPFWMAPEVITRSAYGGAADVWSLGIVAWELVIGAPPLGHVNPVRALFMIPKVGWRCGHFTCRRRRLSLSCFFCPFLCLSLFLCLLI